MSIVPLYAAALGLLLILLSTNVIKLRRALKVAIGDGDDQGLLRAIRVHANFAEYVPMTLLLLFFVETQSAPALLVHGLCALFLAGRCMHAYGVSQTSEDYRFRRAGMVITFITIIASAITLFVSPLIKLVQL